MRDARSLLIRGAALAAALGVWVTGGALTLTSAQPRAPRVGLLPPVVWLALAMATAVILTRRTWKASDRTLPFAVGALALLPWLPLPVPAAFYVWTGHLTSWLWIAIAVAVAAPIVWRRVPDAFALACRNPDRAPWIAAVVAATAYLAGAWQVSPRLPTGDEPHYLVITQSLLRDRDLKIENNHQRGDYHAYYPPDLKPDYLTRGQDGAIYSIHPIGLPVIVLPLFALGGYPAVVAFLAVASGLATALMWAAAWRITGDAPAAWFGWATVALSVPFFFHAFTVYPDGLAAALVMVVTFTVIAGQRATVGALWASGLALALLPWLHTRYAVAALVLGLSITMRQPGAPQIARRAVAIVLLPLLSAACWFAFFYEIYGTPDPRAAYGGHTQTALANVARGAIGLLIDQRFGVLPNAPVYACSALGFVTLGRTRPRLAGELALLAGAYGCAAAAFEMWWAGYSSAARFLVPVLMPLSIPAAVWFQSTRGRASHILGIGGLLISLLMTATICVVDRGALLLNVRTAPSLLWTWLSPLVDVTSALPSLFENEPAVALAHACVWMAAIVITALAGTLVARRGASPSVVALAMGLIGAVAGMVALTIVWRSNRAAPLRPVVASLALLRQYDPDSRQLALRYAPLRRLTLSDLPPRLVLADAWPASIPRDRPMTFLEHLPPGVYAIDALASRAGGSVSVTLDRQFGPAWRWELLPEQRVWHREFRLPVAVAALELTLDDAARQAVDTLTLRAVTVAGTRERPARGEARDVIRYGSVLAFQMSEAGYIERGGIWAPGGAEADFILDADTPQPLRLFLRNIPAENQVTLDVGGQRSEIAFGPGEERIVDVPISPDGHATRVRIAAARGAKPVDFEKGSTDTRSLGVWVEVR